MGFRAKREAAKAARQEERNKAVAEAAKQRQEKIDHYLQMPVAELHKETIDALAYADEAFAHSDVHSDVLYGRANVLSQLATIAGKKERRILPGAHRGGTGSSPDLYQQAVAQFVDADEAFRYLHVDSAAYFSRASNLSQLAMYAQNQEGVVSGVVSLIDKMGVTRK